MRDYWQFGWFGLMAVIVIGLLFLARRRTKAIEQMLGPIVQSAGWSNLTKSGWVGTGVSGMWQRFPIEIHYHQRQKSAPERFIVRVVANNDLQLNIKRRFEGFFSNKPLTWFGPPLVEVHQPSAGQMWVRGDQSLAERLFSDSKIAKAISDNLLTKFDEVQIDRSGLRVIRSLDAREVKEKYNLTRSGLSGDVMKFDPIAREQIAFAQALVDKLVV